MLFFTTKMIYKNLLSEGILEQWHLLKVIFKILNVLIFFYIQCSLLFFLDQSICGSCWSFDTNGTIEGAYFLKQGKRKIILNG